MNSNAAIEIVKTKKKSFALVAALVLLNVVLYLYASLYQTPRIENLQGKWFAKRKSAAADAALDTATIYSQGVEDLKLWHSRIIPKREFAHFVGNLFETASNNSLAFRGVTYRAAQVKNEDLVTYTLDFNVAGKYAAVKSFLADLGRMHEILTIDTIALSNSKAIEDSVALKVQLTVYLRMVG